MTNTGTEQDGGMQRPERDRGKPNRAVTARSR
jgi:hypothetical protein